jgi:hypothetical protein
MTFSIYNVVHVFVLIWAYIYIGSHYYKFQGIKSIVLIKFYSLFI